MLKKHIVLFETKQYEWVAFSTTSADARRLLNVNDKYNIFYIFECDLRKQYPYTMKLKTPLNNHYECKKINKYNEENFEENEESIVVSYDESDEGVCFDVNHNG